MRLLKCIGFLYFLCGCEMLWRNRRIDLIATSIMSIDHRTNELQASLPLSLILIRCLALALALAFWIRYPGICLCRLNCLSSLSSFSCTDLSHGGCLLFSQSLIINSFGFLVVGKMSYTSTDTIS